MKRKENWKKGCGFVLAALLALPCLSLSRTQAAGGIDVNLPCSLTVSVEISSADGSNDEYLEDFNGMSIPVSVYRVADVDVTGREYTPVGIFTGTAGEAGLDLSKISQSPEEVTAEDWRTYAEQADALLKAAQEAADQGDAAQEDAGQEGAAQEENPMPQADGTVVVQSAPDGSGAARGTISDLQTGLYLVVPAETYNADMTVLYQFTPYLTALPSSDYTLSGAGSDEWEYDTVIGLKPEAVPQYGRLHITKALQNYNVTLGPATFVFRIVGVDQQGEIRYEEVESMTFTDAGSNTITLDQIPAGLTVTVTEIYSGASYTIEGSDEDSALIWSEDAVKPESEGGLGMPEASVEFRNTYDGGNRGGYGVTNHIELDSDGGWIWENPTSPAQE